MRPDFETAFRQLMDLEGWGVVHEVEGDPGGLTVYGIARNRHPEMYRDGLPTQEEAERFYREEYWIPLGLDQLRSHDMAFEVFEFAVNAGTGRAVRRTQITTNEVLWLMGEERETLRVDGLMGPRTRAAMNQAVRYERAWVKIFNYHQLTYYRDLPADLQRRFLLGWTRRT